MNAATPIAAISRDEVRCGRYSGPYWAVFATHPQAERYAASELARAGYRAYVPLIAIRRRDPVVPSMFHTVRVPLFCGYGFVELEAEQGWVPIRYTRGVRDVLIGTDGRPQRLPHGVVDGLMADDAGRCELASAALPSLPVGTMAEITAGPFLSYRGAVLACDGVRTELSVALFGREVPMWLDRSALEAVQPPP